MSFPEPGLEVTLQATHGVDRGRQVPWTEACPLTERTLFLRRTADGAERRVTHLHFQEWPDHSSTEVMPVLGVVWRVNALLQEEEEEEEEARDAEPPAPIIVHCSAG